MTMSLRQLLMVLMGVVAMSALGAGQTILDQCPPCQLETCPPATDCAAGVVKDVCGCCLICARLEGEKCDNYTLPLPRKNQYGFCGDNMACLLRKDLENSETPEALCVCENDSPVCGSDGRTYATMCRLRQAAQRRSSELSMVEWGPCQTQPEITSAPENVEGFLYDEMALSCEARGYPIPTLNWHFQSAITGQTVLLPGDDQMIALQIRGGPEPYMVSSWIQILKLRAADAGTYTCSVSNPKGFIQAVATVVVTEV